MNLNIQSDNKRLVYQILIISVIIYLIAVFGGIIKKDNEKEIPVTIDKSIATTTPQYILLSFDGSKSNEMWRDTLDFADEMNSRGISLAFTYFINSIYLLDKDNANIYRAPHQMRGSSAIGFAEDFASIDERIGHINTALNHGHEIASHNAGHWQGGSWNKSDWDEEFSSFNKLMFDYENNNPQYHFTNKLKLKPTDIKGFRAPDLSINNYMYKALSDGHYSYDSSEVGIHDEWPKKDAGGIWHIPISTVYFPSLSRSIIAVDYSIWMNDTFGLNILKAGTKEWENTVRAIADAYKRHFDKNYSTNRAPMVIDNHFSRWNDGVYWEAMKDFARYACGKPSVRCSTFSDLVRYVER